MEAHPFTAEVSMPASLLVAPLLAVLAAFPPAHADACVSYGNPRDLPSVSYADLDESSGLAQSRRNPNVWWTHNDSGDGPVLYAFSLKGQLLGESDVLGASATDWEDLAAGPCPVSSGQCLYVGDIGDNGQSRSYVTIWAMPEPVPGADTTVEATWKVVYPGGPENAETLLVHPLTGDITLVTKDSAGLSGVYRVPRSAAGSKVTATLVGEIDFADEDPGDALATGGDWSRDGRAVAIRTYGSIWEWTTDPSDPDAHWEEPATVWSAPSESQGEAVAYTAIGDLLTTSEDAPMAVHRMRCTAR